MNKKEYYKKEEWGAWKDREQCIKEIETVKRAVAKSHGTFKYDSCYDDCIRIIKAQ